MYLCRKTCNENSSPSCASIYLKFLVNISNLHIQRKAPNPAYVFQNCLHITAHVHMYLHTYIQVHGYINKEKLFQLNKNYYIFCFLLIDGFFMFAFYLLVTQSIFHFFCNNNSANQMRSLYVLFLCETKKPNNLAHVCGYVCMCKCKAATNTTKQ